jgi:hypothetical protein
MRYTVGKGVILFNDVTAAEIWWTGLMHLKWWLTDCLMAQCAEVPAANRSATGTEMVKEHPDLAGKCTSFCKIGQAE